MSRLQQYSVNPMRICHVSATLQAGSGTAIADWIFAQIADGHVVAIICSPLRDDLDQIRKQFPSAVEFYPLNLSREVSIINDAAAIGELCKLLKILKPDILHLHSSKAGLVGRIAGWRLRIPTFYSPHGLAFLRTDVSLLARAIYFIAEWISGFLRATTVACSQTEFDYLKWMPGRKCVIPNGVRLEHFNSQIKPVSQGEPLRIVMCGRVTAQKNPLLARTIANACPAEWEWVWIGDGELRGLIENKSRIRLLGWMSRGKTLTQMAMADVFVHTSLWEGMPMVLLEAMALGLPIVASNVVGNRDLVVQGVTGFLANSVEDFVRALTVLEASPALREQQARAAMQRIRDEFDQEKLAQRWLDLYRAALS